MVMVDARQKKSSKFISYVASLCYCCYIGIFIFALFSGFSCCYYVIFNNASQCYDGKCGPLNEQLLHLKEIILNSLRDSLMYSFDGSINAFCQTSVTVVFAELS